MNHYPRHVGDYIRDTVGLTMLEDGAYSRLLDQYYARETPLPADKSMIYRMARAVSKQERAAVDAVMALFFVLGPDGWRQKRADLELQAQAERSESARQSAKRKWEKQRATADANAMRTHMRTHSEGICDGNAESILARSQKPEAINQGPPVEVRTSGVVLPKNLTTATWTAWKSHLANKGKGCTPQQEAFQLQRLSGHADPESVVRKAIEAGHRNLEPPGGWADSKTPTPADQRVKLAAEMQRHRTTEGPTNEPHDITAESQRVG